MKGDFGKRAMERNNTSSSRRQMAKPVLSLPMATHSANPASSSATTWVVLATRIQAAVFLVGLTRPRSSNWPPGEDQRLSVVIRVFSSFKWNSAAPH